MDKQEKVYDVKGTKYVCRLPFEKKIDFLLIPVISRLILSIRKTPSHVKIKAKDWLTSEWEENGSQVSIPWKYPG